MHQVKYATEILKKFEMIEFNSVVTHAKRRIKIKSANDEEPLVPTMFKQLIVFLRYLCQSRIDICFAMRFASRFTSNNHMKTHQFVAKRILRYINGTMQYGILFQMNGTLELERFSVIRNVGIAIQVIHENLDTHRYSRISMNF